VRRRYTPGLALLAALLAVLGCKPIHTGGLPSSPEQLFSSLSALERPGDVHISGRLRATIGGVEMNLGMDLITDGAGSARLNLSYPFGGHAASLVLQDNLGLLGTAGGNKLVLYSPDAASLVSRWFGDWAQPSMVVDLLLGRVPSTFEGSMAWAEHADRRMLAMELDGDNMAMLAVHRHPTRLRQLVLLDEQREEIAAASWEEWSKVDGYWFPAEIHLRMPPPVGDIEVQIEAFEINPAVIPDVYRVEPPRMEYLSFEELFDLWKE